MIEIKRIWLEKDAIWVEDLEGKKACEYFKDYPRLFHATEEQRNNIESDAFGIHWPDLDEDLSFDEFFKEKPKDVPALYQIFTSHPEINVSAVARRLGIKQSLLAAYISGAKTPSALRLLEIVTCLHAIGKELQDIEIPFSGSSKVADEG